MASGARLISVSVLDPFRIMWLRVSPGGSVVFSGRAKRFRGEGDKDRGVIGGSA